MIFNLFLDEKGFSFTRKGLSFETGEDISEPSLNVQINFPIVPNFCLPQIYPSNYLGA